MDLATRLRTAGLGWEPASGDRFVVDKPHLHDQVFVLSDMVVEVHDHPTGRLIGFNGTTEWALDSLEMSEALWLPGEPELRELLGLAFTRMERTKEGFRVAVTVEGNERVTEEADAAECYGTALLLVLEAGGSPAEIRQPQGKPEVRISSNGGTRA